MAFDLAESTDMYLNAPLAIWASGLGCLGGGGLVSAKLIFVSQEVMTAVAPARKGEE